MTANSYRLVIGNKAWSSWSLRPWLVLKHFGLPFEEVGVKLRQSDSKAHILAHSAAGKVPALQAGDLLVWDSLAIIEFLADRHPDKAIWPRVAPSERAARSSRATSSRDRAGPTGRPVRVRPVVRASSFASRTGRGTAATIRN